MHVQPRSRAAEEPLLGHAKYAAARVYLGR
jgi:hypothetical protein